MKVGDLRQVLEGHDPEAEAVVRVLVDGGAYWSSEKAERVVADRDRRRVVIDGGPQ